MSDLVGNPLDRFSCVVAHVTFEHSIDQKTNLCVRLILTLTQKKCDMGIYAIMKLKISIGYPIISQYMYLCFKSKLL